jgi:hypothetical protein
MRLVASNDYRILFRCPTHGVRALNLGELFQAKCHFSTFQTQPGSASRRCRRSGSILSLAFLCTATH